MMGLTPISTLPEPTKVISLTEARNRYRPGKCQHKHMTMDEDLNTVECDDCGEKLNPVAVLKRFAFEESLWHRRGEELKKLQAALDAKVRCRCQHCGQMTRVRV
ncbi:MAG: hypothetical protein KDH20_03235 [Rhodocyclaceae bacterium]|nr:hypothetical protein [Rhodocyclaceae bacterium]